MIGYEDFVETCPSAFWRECFLHCLKRDLTNIVDRELRALNLLA